MHPLYTFFTVWGLGGVKNHDFPLSTQIALTLAISPA